MEYPTSNPKLICPKELGKFANIWAKMDTYYCAFTSGGSVILNISSIHDLPLIDMKGDTFISLFFLDQIFSAEFLSKISKKF